MVKELIVSLSGVTSVGLFVFFYLAFSFRGRGFEPKWIFERSFDKRARLIAWLFTSISLSFLLLVAAVEC